MLKLIIAWLSFFLMGSTLCMEDEKFSKQHSSPEESYKYSRVPKSSWSSMEQCQRFNLNFPTAADASKARLELERERQEAYSHGWRRLPPNTSERSKFEKILKHTLGDKIATNIEDELADQAHWNLSEYDDLVAQETHNLSNCLLAYIEYKAFEENNK